MASSKSSKSGKQGFTYKLYALNLILAWVFIVAGTVLSVLGCDTSFYASAVPYIFGEVAVYSAVVVTKTKAENLAHINQEGDDICP